MIAQSSESSMSLRTFTRSLRRGLGSAIVELKNNPEREKYRDIVMRSCLKDIAYDTQVEGTKGYYLYTAINMLDNQDEFLRKVSAKFSESLYWRLSEQLFDILCCFSKDGYKDADHALDNKYCDLIARLPGLRCYNLSYCEREQLESLMIRKLNDGFESYKKCINDMGKMILLRGSDDCLWYDWLITNAGDKYGKDAYDYIDSAENKNVAAFRMWYEKSISKDNSGQNEKITTAEKLIQNYVLKNRPQEENPVTIEQLQNQAYELEADGKGFPFRITTLSRKFADRAWKKELIQLAHIAIEETSDFIKAALLRVFNFVDFPLDIGLLFPYVNSSNNLLHEAVIGTLSRFKDKQVRTTAIQLLTDGHIDYALKLLESNFETEDEILIRKHIKKTKRITYGMVCSITRIFSEHKSKTCGDILIHFYYNIECTHCRSTVVNVMIENGVIPKNVLEECQYDSYEETRALVALVRSSKETE